MIYGGVGKGYDQVVEGGGPSSTSVTRWGRRRGGDLIGGGTDTKRGRVILRHRPCGGDLEFSGGGYQSPLHRRHHLPRIPPRIPGGLRYGYRHP